MPIEIPDPAQDNLHARIAERLAAACHDAHAQPGGAAAYGQWPVELELTLRDREQCWVDYVLATYPDEQDLAILDAGSGNGLGSLAFARALLKRREHLTAHLRDIQPGAIEEAIQHYARVPQITSDAQVGSIAQLDLEDESVHGVVCESVLGWIPKSEQAQQAVAHFNRVLKPGGLVYASLMTPFNQVGINNTPHKEDAYHLRLRRDIMWEIVHSSGREMRDPLSIFQVNYEKPMLLFTPRAARELFTRNGFVIEESAPFRNEHYSNGFSNHYPENMYVIARKR